MHVVALFAWRRCLAIMFVFSGSPYAITNNISIDRGFLCKFCIRVFQNIPTKYYRKRHALYIFSIARAFYVQLHISKRKKEERRDRFTNR